MVELDEFEISRREYLKLHFLKTPDILLFVFAVTYILFCVIVGMHWILLFFVLIICYATYRLQCYQFALSPKNTFLYQKRKISFDADKFHVQIEDGSEAHVLLSHILRADRSGRYYRLFFPNRFTFHIIPDSAFRNEEDRVRFETEILGNKMKKESTCAVLWKRIGVFIFLLACVSLICLAFGIRMMFPLSDISEPANNLDKAPQVEENNGHGSNTYNHEFRPADADY